MENLKDNISSQLASEKRSKDITRAMFIFLGIGLVLDTIILAVSYIQYYYIFPNGF